ncbi:Aftiphilin clathrin-binding box domain-containing protein [Caenorhabditis elegans]|uniref:Aftiphilin clathrin-binding box domain-containing protein n=1 Tax=Caenorhabditis elegans TaxID=6239 RepID=H2L0Q4_CAEEL|nr:Aftiphilin clathrin-binding box domain-containing protein [Caenorhabditis elegans]CCD74329.1 Aftiphilin clathrin-binding box domain-containing protein [Caenorhabditis elegans]|eukprot:NP_504165.2 Uncharacterized protein CELE_Y45G5AM.9 [Caenorhabditis elegans]
MEIDGGPPPFCGVAVDDSYDKSEQHEYDEVDDSPDSTSLPLPSASRSRSVTPVKDMAAGHEAVPEASDNNEKGDTMTTALSQDEFTGFQNSEIQKEEDDDDDEWGDFGEAVVAAAPIQARPQSPPPSLKMDGFNNEDDDDDDDWGAFDQARPSTDRTESSPNSSRSQEARHQQSLDEWGAFENSNDLKANGDEWQAEFSSASDVPPPPSDTVLENLELLDEMLENVEFWHDGFQEECREEEESPEMDVVDIPALFDSENLVEMVNSFEVERQRDSRLWLSLRLVEEAISLKFDWNNSEIRKNHLKSLKINPVTAKKEPRAMNSFFDTSNLLLPTPIQATTTSSSTESSHDSSATATNPKTSSSSPPSSVIDSPSVPAVDFDWDTSGLTNPMNRASKHLHELSKKCRNLVCSVSTNCINLLKCC